MGKSVDALITKMEHSRSLLNAAVNKISPQAEIYPSWKIKQLLDHIAGWDQLVVTSLRAYQNGETPNDKITNIDQYNAASVTARQAFTLEQSRQAFDTARQEVLEILRSLPDEMLRRKYPAPWGGNCTIASIVKIFVSHEQEHARQIESHLPGS